MRFLIAALVLLGGDESYSIQITLRDGGGKLIDLPSVSLVRALGEGPRAWRSISRVPHKAGTYAFSGAGPLCTPLTGCNALWGIEARGFNSVDFRLREHCVRWRGENCYALEVTATLISECACPPGAICDGGYIMHFDLRDQRDRRIGCEFDVVVPGTPPRSAEERKRARERFPNFSTLKDGTCTMEVFGPDLPLSRTYEIRADGFETMPFIVRDYCKRSGCGSCSEVELKARLVPSHRKQ